MDDEGNSLVAFHQTGEDAAVDHAPLPLALVALWRGDDLLLVFNQYRQCWELPGGMIDVGETPRQAAVRELREESGHEVEDLVFAGFAQFALRVGPRVEYAAVYAGHAGPSDTFVPNDEISAISWWDGARPLAGRVQVLDLTLGRLARAALHQ